jgi:hypothetical protein
LCLEENGELLRRDNHRAEMRELPSSERVGATAYSRLRSLGGLLIGQILCIAIPWSMNNAGSFLDLSLIACFRIAPTNEFVPQSALSPSSESQLVDRENRRVAMPVISVRCWWFAILK